MPALGSRCRAGAITEPTPFFDLRFDTLTPGVWTGHAGLDLTFVRASTGITQISASEMSAAAAANNQGLIKSRGIAGRVGHRVNRAYTNLVLRSRDLSHADWLAGSGVTYTSSGTSPRAGITDAYRLQVNSGGYSRYHATATNAVHTGSMWRRAHSGTSTHQIGYGPTQLDSSTATTTWERRAWTATGVVQWYLGPALAGGFGSGDAAIAQDVYCDLAQVEAGRIAHDCFLTTGAAGTSTAEDLYNGAATNFPSSGRLSLWYQVVPDGGSGDYDTGSVQIFQHGQASGVSTMAYWNAATRAMTLTAPTGFSTTLGTVMPTWSAGDLLDIWVEIGAGMERAVVRVNEGARTVLGTGPGTSPSVGTTESLRHLADAVPGGGGLTFDGSVARVRAYTSGQRPGWAA